MPERGLCLRDGAASCLNLPAQGMCSRYGACRIVPLCSSEHVMNKAWISAVVTHRHLTIKAPIEA